MTRPSRPGVKFGSLDVGSAPTVAGRIADTIRTLGVTRFQLRYNAGSLPHALAMDAIERFGRDVVPRVRALLADGAERRVEA